MVFPSNAQFWRDFSNLKWLKMILNKLDKEMLGCLHGDCVCELLNYLDWNNLKKIFFCSILEKKVISTYIHTFSTKGTFQSIHIFMPSMFWGMMRRQFSQTEINLVTDMAFVALFRMIVLFVNQHEFFGMKSDWTKWTGESTFITWMFGGNMTLK